MKKIILFFICSFIIEQSFSQPQISIDGKSPDVYPSNWWVGMKMNKIQLMIRITDENRIIPHDKLVFSSSSKDIKVLKVHHPENQHYLFVDIEIAKNAKPQKVNFSFVGITLPRWSFDFELKPRRSGNGTAFAQGVTSKDLVYLLMPDRFSNGDPTK
jgi:hypothetical protein